MFEGARCLRLHLRRVWPIGQDEAKERYLKVQTPDGAVLVMGGHLSLARGGYISFSVLWVTSENALSIAAYYMHSLVLRNALHAATSSPYAMQRCFILAINVLVDLAA